MLFNSHAFAIFILIAFLAYVAIPTWTLKKLSLLLVSYLFYAAWHPEYLLLLIGIAVVDYGLSHLVATSRSPLRRRTILAVCVILNLTILCFFKYLAFFIHCIDGLAGTDLKNTLAIPDWPLPLGISFYTFETISYVVDVYRGKTKPARSFLDYAMFLAFFPHLVAGPIVRAYDFLPQCETPRSLSRRQIGWGLGLLILGLFQKTFLADHLLSPLVDRVFESTSRATAPDVIFSTLAFSAQIYFDFSGYSLCGLGLASCFGFVLTDNFRSPYAAIGIADFWHRWHISLSTWLRDYLYISLGGSRGTSLATYRNLLVTMLLGGLWHGASTLFILWGLAHGLVLCIERLISGTLDRFERLDSVRKSALWMAIVWSASFTFVSLAWISFRARSFDDAVTLLSSLTTRWTDAAVLSSNECAKIGGIVIAMLSAQWFLRERELRNGAAHLSDWAIVGILAIMMFCIVATPGVSRAFIYFDF